MIKFSIQWNIDAKETGEKTSNNRKSSQQWNNKSMIQSSDSVGTRVRGKIVSLFTFPRFSGKSLFAPYARVWSTMGDRVRTDKRARCRMFYFLESRSTVRSVEFLPRYNRGVNARSRCGIFRIAMCTTMGQGGRWFDGTKVNEKEAEKRRRKDAAEEPWFRNAVLSFLPCICGSTWFAAYTLDRKFRGQIGLNPY